MERPPAGAGASGPTITPDAARLVFRQKREAVGYSQIGLSRLLGRSTAYVAHIENGRLNPSPDARAALAARLGESPEILFAGFSTPKEERDAALGRLVGGLYDDGYTEAKIADALEIGRGRVRSRRLAAGRTARPNLATFVPPAGRITARQAAQKYGLDLRRLCAALDAGTVPRGERHDVAGSHPIRTVDEVELAAYLASRPMCSYPGCDRQATLASDACTGAHARAVETMGTKLSAETRARMSESQTKRHRRADEELERLNEAGFLNLRQVARERHVAPNTVSRWVEVGFLRAEPHTALRPLLLVSRAEFDRFNAEEWRMIERCVGTRRLPHWSSYSKNRWDGRSAPRIAEARGKRVGRDPGLEAEEVARILELREKDYTQQRIANALSVQRPTPVSRDQVKRALAGFKNLGETPPA